MLKKIQAFGSGEIIRFLAGYVKRTFVPFSSPGHVPMVPVLMAQNPYEERRRERAFFETDRHLISGDVTLPPDGYQSRFSDSINRTEIAFIPLTDVEITSIASGEVTKREFVVLGKGHIKLAYPVDAESP